MKEEYDSFSKPNTSPNDSFGLGTKNTFDPNTNPQHTAPYSLNSANSEEHQPLQDSLHTLEKPLLEYMFLFEHAPTGYLTLDKNGDIFKINLYAAKLLGEERTTLMNADFTSFISEEKIFEFNAFFDRIFSSPNKCCCEVIIHPSNDKPPKYIQLDGQAVPDGSGCLCIMTDITERKASEDAFRQKSIQYKNMIEQSHDIIFQLEQDGTFSYVSPSWSKIMGHAPEEVVGQSFINFIHPDDVLYCIEFLQAGLEKGGSDEEVIYRAKHKLGHYIWSAATGSLLQRGGKIAYLGNARDITLRREEELKNQALNERFAFATRSAGMGIWDFNIANNTLIWDEMMYKVFQVAPDEFEGVFEAWSSRVHPEDLPGASAALDATIREKKVFDTCFRIICKDGAIKYIKGDAQLIQDADGNPLRVIGINYDITDLKNAEASLLKSELKYRSLFESANDAIILFEAETETILEVNDKATEVYGFSKAEFMGMNQKHITKNIAKGEKMITLALQNENIVDFETQHYTKKGAIIDLLVGSSVIVYGGKTAILSINRDITERKKVEAALQKSEDNLQTVFENTDMGYILFNNEFKILNFNRPAQLFYLREDDRPINEGVFLFDYFPEDQAEPLRKTTQKVLEGKKVEFERKVVNASGDEYWYHVIYSPVFNKEKKVENFVLSIEDITDRKKDQLELFKSFDLVSEQNKRLLNFSYIVSHNLRSHTSNIKSILNLFGAENTESEQKVLLKHLEAVVGRLDETLYNLNDVVSIQRNVNLQIEPLILNDYVSKAEEVLEKQIAEKNAKIINQIDKGIMVNYNPAYLESIAFNFLSNAIKYSSPDRQPVVTINAFYEETRLVLQFSDNGLGIDLKRNKDKLFGMYKTFHSNKDAKGLGLFISKNQIEAMGGKVEVESELGVGTQFKIYLTPATH
jgi:PAS domain S-box-containing protein